MPSMGKTKWEKLEEAYKNEKYPRMVTGMLAVYMVHVRKKSIDETTRDIIHILDVEASICIFFIHGVICL